MFGISLGNWYEFGENLIPAEERPYILIRNPHSPFVRLLSCHLSIRTPRALVDSLQILHGCTHHRVRLTLQKPGDFRSAFIKTLPCSLADIPVMDPSLAVCRREDRTVLPHLRLLNPQRVAGGETGSVQAPEDELCL